MFKKRRKVLTGSELYALILIGRQVAKEPKMLRSLIGVNFDLTHLLNLDFIVRVPRNTGFYYELTPRGSGVFSLAHLYGATQLGYNPNLTHLQKLADKCIEELVKHSEYAYLTEQLQNIKSGGGKR